MPNHKYRPGGSQAKKIWLPASEYHAMRSYDRMHGRGGRDACWWPLAVVLNIQNWRTELARPSAVGPTAPSSLELPLVDNVDSTNVDTWL